MTIVRIVDPNKAINREKLELELRAAGIPLEGLALVDADTLRIEFMDSATSGQQTTTTDAVIAAHDSTIPLGRFSCTTTGARFVAFIPASSSRLFLPSMVRIGVAALTGFISAPTVSLGSNSPNYDNVLPATALGGAIGLTSLLALRNQALVNTFVLNSDRYLFANVTVAANATTYALHIQVEGGVFNA